MQVAIKDFSVAMEVKNKGIEFEIRDNNGNFLGDVIFTKTGLTWCDGKTRREGAHRIDWSAFINLMHERAASAA